MPLDSAEVGVDLFGLQMFFIGIHDLPPVFVDFAGIDAWPGKQMHSHSYRVPEPFLNQVGCK